MAAQIRSPVSASSGDGSPEIYQVQPGGGSATGAYTHQKTYRHIPGHPHPPVAAGAYQQFNGNGMAYPTHMGVQNGQFYPPVAGPNSYVPVSYNPAIPEQSYYYYPTPNNWTTMHGPMPLYTSNGYASSPPSTPPQSHPSYGFPMIPAEYYNPEGRFLPPSPPQINYNVHNAGHANVPALDNRRNSWSSSGASETPATPFMPTALNGDPAVVGGDRQTMYRPSYVDRRGKSFENGKRSLESLLLAGPPLPRAIPAVYSHEAPRTVGQCLENPTNTTNVYIRGLPPDTDDDKLYEMTRRFGAVTSHKAIMDTEHGTCKGYGFARYETKEQAENCIRGLIANNYEAGFARESFNARLKTLADPNSTNVYVSNLPRSMNEKDMQELFPGYVVVSNRILRDANGNSRGVGFARFETRDICEEVIKNFHGVLVGEERLPLQVRYADTSAQKRLKATTTRKRQFRSNEYNSVVNGNYYAPQPSMMQYHPPTGQFKNRVWLRQSSNISNLSNDSGVALPIRDQNSPTVSTKKGWDRSQDWKINGCENRPDWKPAAWRGASAVSTPEKSVKLETVDEDADGDANSDTQSVVTTVPTVLEGGLRAGSITRSSGTFSDPGVE